jgi:hypothetical protein
MADAAAQANGNIDLFLLSMVRHASEHGHTSLCLHMLGVPGTPNKAHSEKALDQAILQQVNATDNKDCPKQIESYGVDK